MHPYKWNKHKIRLFGLALLLAGTATAASSGGTVAAAATAKPLKLVVNGNAISAGSQAPFLDSNGSVYVPLRMVSQLLKSYVDWDGTKKLVSIYAPNHTVKLTLGAKTAQHNDQSFALNAPAKLKNDAVYVPIRFVAQSLGADVKWQSETRTVTVDDGNPYELGYSFTSVTTVFWLDKKSGNLYTSDPANTPAVLTGKLDYTHHDYTSLHVDMLKFGEFVVTMTDDFGEPHVHTEYTAGYVKNKKLIDQAAVRFFQRMTPNVTRLGNQAVLSDGKTVRILNADGSVDKSYDLKKLGGLDEVYGVEGIGENYLLIRPNQTGLLMLVNPETGSKKELYELLDPADQEYALMNDTPYRGDALVVDDEHDGVLDLHYISIKDHKEHKLEVKLKDWL